MRGLCDTMRTFRDSSRRFGESIRKPIANSSHPSEIGALARSEGPLDLVHIRFSIVSSLVKVCPLQQLFPKKLSRNIGLKDHPKDWRSTKSNPRPLVYEASSLPLHHGGFCI